jgi:hypothetical protein
VDARAGLIDSAYSTCYGAFNIQYRALTLHNQPNWFVDDGCWHREVVMAINLNYKLHTRASPYRKVLLMPARELGHAHSIHMVSSRGSYIILSIRFTLSPHI